MSFLEQIKEAAETKAKHEGLINPTWRDWNRISRKVCDSLGKSIKDERMKNLLSQRELAEKSGFSQTTIARVENGATQNIHPYIIILATLNKKITLTDIKSWVELDT